MPITGPSSYVPTTQAFFEHWTGANAALPPTQPLVLEDGSDVGSFLSLRDGLLATRDVVEEKDLDLALARAALQMQKESMLAKINLFNQAVRGRIGSSVYARVLPAVPGIGDGQEPFSKPLVQARKLWAKINGVPPAGFTAPLVLLDGTTLAAFSTALTALAAQYDAVTGADQDFTMVLQDRNDLQEALYAMMKAYRVVVPARFPAGSAILDSLPALTADSSRTPSPVSLAGAWVPAQSAAQLTAGVSADPDLKEYELRWCAGGSYSTETEHVAGSIPAGTPPVFVTTKGLMTAGAVASFRVYVRLTSGGEAGSETVTITRP